MNDSSEYFPNQKPHNEYRQQEEHKGGHWGMKVLTYDPNRFINFNLKPLSIYLIQLGHSHRQLLPLS